MAFSLKAHNSFSVEVFAEELIEITSENQVIDYFKNSPNPNFFILGGGSNMLLTQDIDKTVLHNKIGGITKIFEDDYTVTIEVGSGEEWHELVLWTVQQNYAGIENLSLIPGSVGAAPIQNIGAYGVELKDCFLSLDAIDTNSGIKKFFSKEDCQFAYRDSYFKNQGKDKYFITKLRIQLKKEATIQTSYGAIKTKLEEQGIADPSIKDISDIIISIRNSKLPNPKVLGNSGSFFKNPIVANSILQKIQSTHPEVKSYPTNDSSLVKIPAAWLIENAGWKGHNRGTHGVYKNHALVLVNHGGAHGSEIKKLAEDIKASVKDQFGISLEMEVNVF